MFDGYIHGFPHISRSFLTPWPRPSPTSGSQQHRLQRGHQRLWVSWWAVAAKPLLVDDWLGDFTTLQCCLGWGMEIETFIDLSFLLWYGDWTIMYMGIIGYPVHVQWGKLWQCVHWNWGYTTRGYPIDLADAWLMIITTRIEKHEIKWNKMSDPPKLSTNWTYPASNYIYIIYILWLYIIIYTLWLSSFCPLAHRCSLALESTWDTSPGSNHFPGMLFRRLTGSGSPEERWADCEFSHRLSFEVAVDSLGHLTAARSVVREGIAPLEIWLEEAFH